MLMCSILQAASPVSEAMQVDAPEKLEQAPRRDWDPFGGLLPTIPMSTNTTGEPPSLNTPCSTMLVPAAYLKSVVI